METILKKYDDMRIMRMIKKQLLNCDHSLEELKKEYNDKDDELLVLGITREVTKRPVDEEAIEALILRLEALQKEIANLEEDKSKLAIYNPYTGR
ncbi:hypothetical protein [Acetobacterium bakii]|uniref:Uncharacterized protein n=1 Tax=Acetobacterium bakii TaxID=52689 RepID=A0A0L6U430_9FIRM|nr:hypothetical protein [Acetobacterium bakii]KNZ42545.1 hypothetical protein AKG39_05155 [Acetobacterium bakii]